MIHNNSIKKVTFILFVFISIILISRCTDTDNKTANIVIKNESQTEEGRVNKLESTDDTTIFFFFHYKYEQILFLWIIARDVEPKIII